MRWRHVPGPVRVGVSSCLLGESVRFDGGHKRDAFLVERLGRFVEFVRVCPEVELGMSIPRPAIRLEARGNELRLVDPKGGTDHSLAMRRFARRRTRELEGLELCGYVLKKDSPSCGMERVRVAYEDGQRRRNGRGLFAEALMHRFPQLPVEEEGRLQDPTLRENFIERVFAYRRLRTLFGGRWTRGELVEFHTAHKHQLLAHDETRYRQLGRLVAGASRLDRAELRDRYCETFMAALCRRATTRRQANVLQHMAGYVSEGLDPASRRELAEVIDDYRAGLIPLVVPITLLRHHARVHQAEYLLGQVYLDPHPKELMLRNHA
jgi:uncharacterized protein YbgA (DUF1722 family)/uncharacterized protein YbbK (DUF523 family)